MLEHELLVIGGSAGALDPLVEILGALPADVSIPIAIVLHVPPDRPNLLSGLLADACRRPALEPEDKQPIERGKVYVAPPNYHLLVERNRTFALSVDEPVHFSRPSIDVLFESASAAFGHRMIGLVLSGTNADGANGLASIAAGGGVALVQHPNTAIQQAMPAAAAARVPAARQLAPRDVSSFLLDLSRSSSPLGAAS